jgi:aminopeptidase YwaD
MKKQLFNFLILSLSAQTTKQTAPKPDLAEQNLRKHVGYLASDKLTGRRTGEQGATFAAGYVANMFANYMLKAGVVQTTNGKTKAGYLQPFPYVTGVTLGNGNRLMITTPKSNQLVNVKGDWMPFGSSPNADISNAETVFAGYGIISTEPKVDDYAGLDVRGKTVLAIDGNTDNGNPQSPLQRFNIHAKAKIAKDRGAVALILISRESKFENDKATALKYDATFGETAIPVIIVSRAVGATIFGSGDELRAAEKFPAEHRQNIKVLLKIDVTKKSTDTYNVIGVLEGTDPVLKNEAIIIGAHYDHLGRGGAGSLAANSQEIHHGADDNASGTSALIELARQFTTAKNNKRTIIFIAFSGEEEGLLGSNFYVNNPVFPLNKTVAMINMDMVGRLKDNNLTIGGIGTASEWRNLVTSKQPTNLGKIEVPGNPPPSLPVSIGISGGIIVSKQADTTAFNLQLNEDGFGPSDHSSFYGKQIPVLFFFTGTHTDYHKPTDTADKINYEGLKRITNYVAEIVRAIDQNPIKPTYTLAKSSGTGEDRRGFSISLGTIPNYADSNDGLLLDGVRDNSPAAKAGIKAGDKIIKLAGKEIRNVSDYTFVLGEMKPDVEYEVIVLRVGAKLSLKIIPAVRKQ